MQRCPVKVRVAGGYNRYNPWRPILALGAAHAFDLLTGCIAPASG